MTTPFSTFAIIALAAREMPNCHHFRLSGRAYHGDKSGELITPTLRTRTHFNLATIEVDLLPFVRMANKYHVLIQPYRCDLDWRGKSQRVEKSCDNTSISLPPPKRCILFLSQNCMVGSISLVTGAGGSITRHVVQQLLLRPATRYTALFAAPRTTRRSKIS